MDEISKEEQSKYVRQFLKEFKALIDEKGLIVTDRVTNKDSLLVLGLTGKQRDEIVLSLSVTDYSSGPIEDKYKSGSYWIFSTQFEGVEIYIKLKISGHPGAEYASCFSFHKSERPLKHPLTD